MNNPQSSEHRSVDELLPWYVNGTLDDRERAQVERHLTTCSSCQENVRLWSNVRSAVQDHSPVPLVPEPDADALLNVVDDSERGWFVANRRALYPFAAAALLVIAVAITFVAIDRLTPEAPIQFETVISETADDTVRYIVEMRFDEMATNAQRQRILEVLGNAEPDTPLEADTVMLHVAADSPTGLQERIDDLRALSYVADARIVAVHLPVD